MSKSLQLNNTAVEIQNFNNDFLLLRSSDSIAIKELGKAIFERRFEFIEEVIVSEIEICLKLNTQFETAHLDLLRNQDRIELTNPVTYRLPVLFSQQDDWSTIELVSGLSRQTSIDKLLSINFSIAFFGFLPGFLYLDGLPESLHLPRKTTPSKYVEANSLAIGGKYLGLYAIDSPGGWHVIGQTPIQLLETPNLPPVRFQMGDQIQLVAIDQKTYENLRRSRTSLIQYNA